MANERKRLKGRDRGGLRNYKKVHHLKAQKKVQHSLPALIILFLK